MGRAFPGQRWRPPRADQENAWDESAEYFQLKQRLSKRLPDQRMPVPTELDVLKVRNSTGADRNESEVVQLYQEIIDQPTRLHPWLECVEVSSRCERYGVLRWATKANEIEWCQVSGPTFALVDLTNGHKRCSPKAGEYHFVGDDDGPIEILWKPDEESGVHECIVELEQVVPPCTYVAKVPADGIPAREGLVLGRAVCEIYKASNHDYAGPESKSLALISKPNGDPLTKEIYNVSRRPIVPPGDEDLYITLHREECGNWFASTQSESMFAQAILAEDLCPTNDEGSGTGGSGDPEQLASVINAVYLPDCTPFTPAKVTNPLKRRGPPGSTVLLIRKQCNGGGSGSGSVVASEEEWIIFSIEARRTCLTIGLRNNPSCLTYGILHLAAEFCDADVPTSACLAVDYKKCSGELPACDTSWTFIIDQCCGNIGSGSGE